MARAMSGTRAGDDARHGGGSNCLLSAHDLAIGYPQRRVGAGLHLDLYAGELFCVLGPNGSGKSTLFRTLLGLLPAMAGTVRVGQDAIGQLTRRELARRVGYVPQAGPAVFPFTVLDMVLMGRTSHQGALASPSSRDHAHARDSLARLGIGALASRRYDAISGGERQLALIARALAQQPSALILDEPTASLDFGNQIRVMSTLRELARQGLGVLLCTHQPDHALHFADRVALFKAGQLHYTGTAQASLTAARLAWLYDLDEALIRARLPVT